MRLHTIRITNFRSFKAEQSFHFPEEPGLYFMQGINSQEPRLEANGAGKSTIWEALLWCIYGKTSRGLKAGDVCNWDADKGTCVEIDFTSGSGEECTVKRTWKPNAWELSWKHADQVEDLTKEKANAFLGWLGLEFAPFLHCILMAQAQPMFLDLKHDQQAALFSEVMGLDHWIEFSSKASKKASAQDIISRGLERKLAEVEGQLSAQRDFRGSVDQFENDRKVRLDAITEPYHDKLKQLSVLKAAEEEANALVKRRRESLKVANAEVEAIMEKSIRPAQKAYDDIRSNDARAQLLLEQAVHRLEKIKQEKDCPTCKRPVDKNQHHAHLQTAREDLADCQADAEKTERKLANAEQVLEALNKHRGHVDKALTSTLRGLTIAEESANTQRHAINRIEKELDGLEYQAEAIEKEVNPFLDVQAKVAEEGRILRLRQVDLRDELDGSDERYKLYSFWVRGFKELRLQLIAEALTELEIEVNSCVTALGLVNWELRFQVDRETKGGNIQRGFSVQVLSPSSDKPTPWEAWSGGESQRLRLAATMGLSNLIRSRMGVELALEVWDEPSTALSPQGVRDLLEALEHRAHLEQRQIWVVDHTAHSFGGFAGGATITKSRKGSSVEQY